MSCTFRNKRHTDLDFQFDDLSDEEPEEVQQPRPIPLKGSTPTRIPTPHSSAHSSPDDRLPPSHRDGHTPLSSSPWNPQSPLSAARLRTLSNNSNGSNGGDRSPSEHHSRHRSVILDRQSVASLDFGTSPPFAERPSPPRTNSNDSSTSLLDLRRFHHIPSSFHSDSHSPLVSPSLLASSPTSAPSFLGILRPSPLPSPLPPPPASDAGFDEPWPGAGVSPPRSSPPLFPILPLAPPLAPPTDSPNGYGSGGEGPSSPSSRKSRSLLVASASHNRRTSFDTVRTPMRSHWLVLNAASNGRSTFHSVSRFDKKPALQFPPRPAHPRPRGTVHPPVQVPIVFSISSYAAS